MTRLPVHVATTGASSFPQPVAASVALGRRNRNIDPESAEEQFGRTGRIILASVIVSALLLLLGIALLVLGAQSGQLVTIMLAILAIGIGGALVIAIIIPSVQKLLQMRGILRDRGETEGVGEAAIAAATAAAMDVASTTPLIHLSIPDRAAVIRILARDQAVAIREQASGQGHGTPRASAAGRAPHVAEDHLLQQQLRGVIEQVEVPRASAASRQSTAAATGPASWRAVQQARLGAEHRHRRGGNDTGRVYDSRTRHGISVHSRHDHWAAMGDAGPGRFIRRLSRSRSEPPARLVPAAAHAIGGRHATNATSGQDDGASAASRARRPAYAEAPAPRQALTDPLHDDCAICMEPLRDSCARCAVAGGRGRCELATGKCGHKFHACCIGDWVVSCRQERRAAKCPVDNVLWSFQRDADVLASFSRARRR